MKKLFVSLPMSGLPVETIRKRQYYYKRLTELYLDEEVEFIDTIVNTHDERDRIGCLGESISKMSKADIVFLGKGWQYSNGCQVEEKVASVYGLYILTEAKILIESKNWPVKNIIFEHPSYEQIDKVDWEAETKKSNYKNDNNCWIPASTLPKKDGRYLVTRSNGVMSVIDVVGFDRCLSKIDEFIFSEKEGYRRPGWYDEQESWTYEVGDVIAWMELPKTYKVDEFLANNDKKEE